MREQVITPRATGRGASAGQATKAGGIVQRPARRGRGAAASERTGSGLLRRIFSYFPLAGKVLLAIATGLLIFAGYRAAASASFFQARTIEVNTTSRASADEIKAVVRRASAQTGVWRADLDEISRELQKVSWVRSAVISRVLPDGLRVRVTERVPLAVLRTSAGRLVWVDTDAVMLGQVSPNDQIPAFFIRGLDESATVAARAANRERMQKYDEMRAEWEAAGLSERVSEVNLEDLRDVRVQLAGDDARIEVRIGRENFGYRLKKTLAKLDESRSTPVGPFIVYIDASRVMNKDDSLVLGLSPNAPNFGGSGAGADVEQEQQIETARTRTDSRSSSSSADSSKPEERAKKSRDDAIARQREKERRKKDKKEKAAGDAASQSRPRRVG
ncbi:MAG TPA: FtsQ-type POTRA domain-containing protein [Pyrinomonadaceae bacterium]|nr:FtsQ-type POTRA domain-containing protein [Pyrinomonadaceae bacterium]